MCSLDGVEDNPDKGLLREEIENLKILLMEKQQIIEEYARKFKEMGYDAPLETKDDMKRKTYKKVEHINLEIEKRLDEVHAYYKQEILKMSEKFLTEIQELKDERRRLTSDSTSAVSIMRRECDLQLADINKTITYYKGLLKGKE